MAKGWTTIAGTGRLPECRQTPGFRVGINIPALLHPHRKGEWPMKWEVYKDADSVAQMGAKTIAADARTAVAARGRSVLAVSGGRTPWIMLRALAGEDIPWAGVHLFQTDERVAPTGDPDRNLTRLRESLLQRAPLRPEQIHAMPVEADDLQAAA